MTGKPNHIEMRLQIWKSIAWVAGVFAFIISMLLIVNYMQINRHDPVDVETINALVQRLSENPSDELLRIQIRELDLLARKAYFTNLWQLRTGGLMLVVGLAVMMIALQIIQLNKKKIPVVYPESSASLAKTQRLSRKWISVGGGALVFTALLFAYLSHKQLADYFRSEAFSALQPVQPVEVESAAIIQEEILTDQIEEVTQPLTNKLEEIQVEEIVAETIPEGKLTDNQVLEERAEIVTPAPVKEAAPLFPSEEELKNNFTSFRGFGGNGVVYQSNFPTQWDGVSGENIKWKVEIPLPGYSSPIIWKDKLFLTGANANLREIYCYNKLSGALLWTARAENIPGSPGQSPDVTEDTGHAAPSMTTDGERVYAIFANGDVIALDMEGHQIWAKNLGKPKNHYGHSSSLIMYQSLLIVQYDHGKSAHLIALDGPTGEQSWITPRDVKISWASPIVVSTGERAEIMVIADPYIASYNPETGEELWRVEGIYGEVGPSLVYADGMVFGCNEYALLQAIQLGQKPQVLWDDYEYLSDVPSPVATHEYLILATSYGVVVCYDTKTGNKLWIKEFDHGFYASPLIVDDKVYLLDRKGVMTIFKLDKEYIQLAHSALGEESVCTPAFADGRIYIRAGNHLYCVGY